MTDNDIVKALECCINSNCGECPMIDKNECNLDEFTLDLINRLQEENERLQNRVDEYNIQVANQREQIEKYEPIKETLCVLWENMLSISVARGKEKPTLEELAEAVDYIKAKAYKECIEKVKDFLKQNGFMFCSDADNILKEMEGGASEVED